MDVFGGDVGCLTRFQEFGQGVTVQVSLGLQVQACRTGKNGCGEVFRNAVGTEFHKQHGCLFSSLDAGAGGKN